MTVDGVDEVRAYCPVELSAVARVATQGVSAGAEVMVVCAAVRELADAPLTGELFGEDAEVCEHLAALAAAQVAQAGGVVAVLRVGGADVAVPDGARAEDPVRVLKTAVPARDVACFFAVTADGDDLDLSWYGPEEHETLVAHHR